jgi:four helix bundle protein
MFPYRRLEVWKCAHAIAVTVLRAFSRYHGLGQRDLAAQRCRAATSIVANIAEGAGAGSHALFARYLGIALGSAHETEALLLVGIDAGLIERYVGEPLVEQTARLRAMLFALRRRVVRDGAQRSEELRSRR